MLRADWNGLGSGDNVLVHHNNRGQPQLIPGVVVSVATVDGSNDVGIRLAGRALDELVHPGRMSVHHDPIELDGHCWRCTAGQPVRSGRRDG